MIAWTEEVARKNSESLKNWHEKVWLPREEERRRQKEEQQKKKTKPRRAAGTNGQSRDERYALAALAAEVEKVATASPGERNSQYNKSCFAVGQLVGAGLLAQSLVEAELPEAARRVGLEEREIASTLRSGLEAGMQEPRTRPETATEQAAKEVHEANGQPPPAGVREVPLFPVHFFPPMLERFIREGAASCRCPVDFFGAPMLVAAGTAIGASRCLEVKDDWHVLPNLYLAVVGQPARGKTPALSKVMRPVKWQHRANLARYKQEKGDWRKADPNTRGDAPTFQRTYTTDSTGEKLAVVLSECPRGLLLFKDELTAWIRGMDQYKTGGKGTERQGALSCWSNEPFSIERKSNDEGIPVTVYRPVISVLGGIQPDLLPLLADKEGRQDGFVDRILFAYPEIGHRQPWTWFGVSPDARREWNDTLSLLWKLDMVTEEQEDRLSRGPRTVQLSAGARRVFEGWVARHEAEQDAQDFPTAVQGAYGKMDSQLCRIALILHLLWEVCSGEFTSDLSPDLGEDIMDAACQIVSYFKAHAQRAHGILTTGEEERLVSRAVDWLRRHGSRCTLRDVYGARVGGIRKASEALKLFELLKDYGLGEVKTEKSDGNGRDVTWFVLH